MLGSSKGLGRRRRGRRARRRRLRRHDGIQRGPARRVRPAQAHPRHGHGRDRRRVPLSDARPVRAARSTTRRSPPRRCRAYNRWLADYCKPYPDRLFGVAMLPLQSIDLAIEEMKFARKELGFKRRLPAAEPVQQPDDPRSGLRAVLERGRGSRFRDRLPRGRQRRHAAGRRRPLRDARRPAHHHPHDGDDAGRAQHDLGRRVREASEAARRVPGDRAAAGSRRGSTAWTAISTIRASTTAA